MDGGLLLRRVAPAMALAGTMGLVRATSRAFDPAALADAEARLLRPLRTPRTDRFVQAGAHAIHTVIVGAGPPLVMLHGHGGGVGVWVNNIEALARHFRLYLVDWLGWGRSDRPRFTGHTAEAARNWWVNSLEDWRRAVGLSDFSLLGHSLGGWVAAEYAMAYGHHLRQLILVNPAGLVDEVHPAKSIYYRVSPQRMIQACGGFGPRLVSRGCAEHVALCSDSGTALADYYYQLSVAPLSGQVAFEQVLTPRHWHLSVLPRADRLLMPTTILWGLNDDLLRIQHAHRFQARLPQGRMVLFHDARHAPNFEAAGAFNEAVIACRAAVAA